MLSSLMISGTICIWFMLASLIYPELSAWTNDVQANQKTLSSLPMMEILKMLIVSLAVVIFAVPVAAIERKGM